MTALVYNKKCATCDIKFKRGEEVIVVDYGAYKAHFHVECWNELMRLNKKMDEEANGDGS